MVVWWGSGGDRYIIKSTTTQSISMIRYTKKDSRYALQYLRGGVVEITRL